MKNNRVLPSYDEEKAARAASIFLKLAGGKMAYIRLVKLLYNLDREALKRWGRPVTFDEFFSMEKGQVTSNSYNRIRGKSPVSPSYWEKYITTKSGNVTLAEECTNGALSRAEKRIIQELHNKYKNMDDDEMCAEHKSLPEYQPVQKGKRIRTDPDHLLEKLGKSEDEIEMFWGDMEVLVQLESSS